MKDYGDSFLIRLFGLFTAVFTIIGLFVGIGGFFLINGALSSPNTTLPLPAVIENVSIDNTYVTYEFNNEIYANIPLNFFSSSWKEGQSFMVKIDPENPSKPLPLNTTMFALIPVFIGGTFLVFGISFFIGILALSKKRESKT